MKARTWAMQFYCSPDGRAVEVCNATGQMGQINPIFTNHLGGTVETGVLGRMQFV